MECIEKKVVGVKTVDSAKKDIVEAFIVSDETPAVLPTTGEIVGGMTEDEVFAPFSMIYVIANGDVYIAKEDGTFALMQ